MTNFERIKAMSVEELANMFDGDCNKCIYRGKDCIRDNLGCYDGFLNWLNSEVKE